MWKVPPGIHVRGPAIVRLPLVPLDVGPQQRHDVHSKNLAASLICAAMVSVSTSSLLGVDTYRIHRMMAARVTTAR
jgi:hypothetical protein